MSSRSIICESCRNKRGPQHPEDVANGFRRRIVEITAKKPEDHKIEILGESPETIPLRSLYCDDCGTPIQNGECAWAVTMWRGKTEPDNWEKDYAV